MKQFLHIGCGHKHKDRTTIGFNSPEWNEIRFDIDESVKPDIVGTMTDMKNIADASMDALFSSHNIEHLYPHEVSGSLNEFARVLKPAGFAVITCPDLQSVCALVANNKLTEPAYHSAAGPITPLEILYGHIDAMRRGNLYMAHRCGFTRDSLYQVLVAAKFASVAVFARPQYFDLWAFASKQKINEQEVAKLIRAHGF